MTIWDSTCSLRTRSPAPLCRLCLCQVYGARPLQRAVRKELETPVCVCMFECVRLRHGKAKDAPAPRKGQGCGTV
jgi:hypothetical protein